MISAYHAFHKIEPGTESHPTHFWRRKRASPWHIDYCLIPESWVPKVREVQVGAFEEFSSSDHRPVTIDLAL